MGYNHFLCLVSSTHHNYCEIHSCCCMYQYFIPFCCWEMFCCMAFPKFAYAFTCWWSFGLFPVLGYGISCGHEHVCTCMLILGEYLWEELMGPMVILYLTFWGNAKLSSIEAEPFLHSHHQRVPFSPWPCETLLFSDYYDCHPSECEVVLHCGFYLHFSNDQ